MRFLAIVLVCSAALGVARAQPVSPSAGGAREPVISLLTMEPGDALWERFGHTAIRVRDGRRDGVFSYGAAPFLDPRFIWAFARGEGRFFVVVEPFARAAARYQRSDRTLQQQELLLPPAEKRALVEKLVANTRPPNNRYLYDQLYDNCATRLRDLIDEASQGALKRAARLRQPNRRFRDYTLEAMAGHPVGHWALDLLGGPHQDLPVDGYKEMYLPVHLRDRLAEARLLVNGKSQPLASPIEVLYQRKAGPALSGRPFAARYVMLLLAGLLTGFVLATRFLRVQPRLRKLAAYVVATLSVWSGLFGLLVVPMTLLSRVQNFSPNENALLFLPFDLLFTRQLFRAAQGAPMGRLLRVYLGLRMSLLGYVVVFKLFGALPQHNVTFVVLSTLLLSSALAATTRPAVPGVAPAAA